MREGARVRALIGEGDGKVGRNEKESGGVVKREGGMKGGGGVDREIKVKQGVKNKGKAESEKHSRCVKKGVRGK